MANVLAIARKKSTPVQLYEPIHAYIEREYPDMSASLFDADIHAWNASRDAVVATPDDLSTLYEYVEAAAA